MKITKYRGITFYRPANAAEWEKADSKLGQGYMRAPREWTDEHTYAWIECASGHDDRFTAENATEVTEVLYYPPGDEPIYGLPCHHETFDPDVRCVARHEQRLRAEDSQGVPQEAP